MEKEVAKDLARPQDRFLVAKATAKADAKDGNSDSVMPEIEEINDDRPHKKSHKHSSIGFPSSVITMHVTLLL